MDETFAPSQSYYLTNDTMPSSFGADSFSKDSYDSLDLTGYNSSNVTYIFDGPIIDQISQHWFFILLPSFIYTAILMTLGLPGNFFVIAVYLLKMSKTTSRHFIISLAACDLINCAFGMSVELALLMNYTHFDIPILCKISRFTTFSMNNCSSLVLVGIAVDRFRRVCLPLKPNMTVRHSKIICIVSAIYSIISAVPALFIYGTREIHRPGLTNNTVLVLKTCYTTTESGTSLPIVFNMYLFICIIIIILSMTIMYLCVGKVVCSRKKENYSFKDSYESTRVRSRHEKSMTFSSRLWKSFSEHSPKPLRAAQNNGRDGVPEVTEPFAIRDRAHSDTSVRRHGGKEIRAGRTTLILFLVTLIYVLSFVPYLGIATWRYIQPRMAEYMTPIQLSVFHVTLRSYLLNSAANPLLYCFLNRQFRMKLGQFIKSCFCCRK